MANRFFTVEGDLALSSDGTRTVGVKGPARVAQAFRARVSIQYGTYEYDRLEGMRWVEILSSKNAEGLLRSELIRIALKDPEVVRAEILRIDYNRKDRKIYAECKLYMTDETALTVPAII